MLDESACFSGVPCRDHRGFCQRYHDGRRPCRDQFAIWCRWFPAHEGVKTPMAVPSYSFDCFCAKTAQFLCSRMDPLWSILLTCWKLRTDINWTQIGHFHRWMPVIEKIQWWEWRGLGLGMVWLYFLHTYLRDLFCICLLFLNVQAPECLVSGTFQGTQNH